jgi:hypothetical protein
LAGNQCEVNHTTKEIARAGVLYWRVLRKSARAAPHRTSSNATAAIKADKLHVAIRAIRLT